MCQYSSTIFQHKTFKFPFHRWRKFTNTNVAVVIPSFCRHMLYSKFMSTIRNDRWMMRCKLYRQKWRLFCFGWTQRRQVPRKRGKLLTDDNTAQYIPEYSIFIVNAVRTFNQKCFLKKYGNRLKPVGSTWLMWKTLIVQRGKAFISICCPGDPLP